MRYNVEIGECDVTMFVNAQRIRWQGNVECRRNGRLKEC